MHERDASLVHVDWQPSRARLRSFGVALLIVLAWSAVGRVRATGGDALAVALGTLAGVSLALCLLRPELLRLPYVTLGAVTYPVRWLVAFLSLALLYYGLVTPIAVCVRRVRKPRAQSGEPDVASAWVAARPRPDKAHYFRQF